jgi:light-regulated signal transduction histidine kinase (bacteriophytochrome)
MRFGAFVQIRISFVSTNGDDHSPSPARTADHQNSRKKRAAETIGSLLAFMSTQDPSDDSTDRRTLLERIAALEQSNQDLERFAISAAHDLQDPLRTMQGLIRLFQQQHAASLSTEGAHLVRLIQQSAVRMQSMIRGMLQYSRLQGVALRLVETDCNSVLQLVLANLSAFIHERNARIDREPLPTLVTDPSQFAQLLQNLISNAIKFSGENAPHVRIWAEERPEDWTFFVKDGGMGIDPRDHARIFTLFENVHTVEEGAGSGIGLAICRRIVERLGGSIQVASDVGLGATFSFSLPKRKPPADDGTPRRLESI